MKVLKFIRDNESAGKQKPAKQKSPTRSTSRSASSLKSSCVSAKVLSPNKSKIKPCDAQQLTELVLKQAELVNGSKNLTLIQMLNTLDLVLEKIEPKPTIEVAQKVYHDLLKQENQKTFDSIRLIQNQIESIQVKQNLSLSRSPTKDISQDLIEFRTATFEAQSSSSFKLLPPEIIAVPVFNKNTAVNRIFSSATTKNGSHFSTKRQSTDSQKIHPFLFHQDYQGSSTGSVLSPNSMKSQKQPRNKQVSIIEPPKIKALSVTQSIDQISCLQKSDAFIKRCQKYTSLSKRKAISDVQNLVTFPKFKLSNSPNTSSSEELFYSSARSQKVIDGSKAIAVGYRVRSMLAKVLIAFKEQVFEKKARAYFQNFARTVYESQILKKAFYTIAIYNHHHSGHKKAKQLSQLFSIFRQKSKHFTVWRRSLHQLVNDKQQLARIVTILSSIKKRKVVAAWHQVIVRAKLVAVQNQTSRYFRHRTTLLKSFHSIKSYTNYKSQNNFMKSKYSAVKNRKLTKRAFVCLKQLYYENRLYQTKTQILNDTRCKHLLTTAWLSLNKYKHLQNHYRLQSDLAHVRHCTQLKSKCVLVLKQFKIYNTTLRARQSLASNYYLTGLKRKLIRGLDETNCHFIRLQVHLEQYHARRRQRLLFSQVQHTVAAKRRLQTLNKFQAFAIMLWTGKLESSKLTYKANQYLLKSALMTLRTQAMSVKKFKAKLVCRKLLSVVDAWSSWSHNRAKRMLKLTNFLHKRHSQQKCRVLQAMSVVQTENRRIYKISTIVSQSRKQYQMQRVWSVWFGTFKHVTTKRLQKIQSRRLGVKAIFHKFFMIWKKQQQLQQKVRQLQSLQKQFQINQKLKLLQKWRNKAQCATLQNKVALCALQQVQSRQKLKILQWFKAMVMRRRQIDIRLDLVTSEKQQKLKQKVWTNWAGFYVPTQKTKKTLFSLLQQQQNQQIVKLCYRALSSYQQFKMQQRRQDDLVISKFNKGPLRRYLQIWHKQVSLRFAARAFAITLPRIEVALAFRAIRYTVCIQDATTEHIQLQHQVKLKKRALVGLRRYWKRTTIKDTQCILMQQLSAVYSAKMHLRAWRELCISRSISEQLANQFVAAFAYWLKKSIFNVLRQRQVTKQKVLLNLQQLRRTQLTKYLNLLRKNATVELNCRWYMKQQRLVKKSKIFKNWRFEVNARCDIIQFRNYLTQKLFINCFRALKDFVVYSNQLQAKVTQGRSNQQKYLAALTLHSLQLHTQKSKLLSRAYTQLTAQINYKLAYNSLASLYTHCTHKQRLNQCFKQVHAVHRLKTVRSAFGVWLPQCLRKMQQFRKLAQSSHLHHKVQQFQALKIWKQYISYSNEMRNKVVKHRLRKQAAQLKPVFQLLKNHTITKKVSRQRLQSVNQFVARKTKLKTFQKIRQLCVHKQINRQLNEKSYGFRNFNLKSKVYYLFSNYAQLQRNKRFCIKKATQNRLQPKALKALKMFCSLKKTKVGMRLMAMSHAQIMLMRTAYLKLCRNLIKARQKHIYNQQLAQSYYCKLLSGVIRAMRQYTVQQKAVKDKRVMLRQAIAKVVDSHTVLFAFNVFKVGVLQSQQRALRVIQYKDKLTTAKVYASFKAYLLYVKRSKLVGQQILQVRQSKSKQAILQRWVAGVNQNVKLRSFQQRKHFQSKFKTVTVLKLLVQQKLQHQYATLHSDARILKTAFKSLVKHSLDIEIRRQKAIVYEHSQYEHYMTRCLLALRFHVITQKSLRCALQKQATKLKYAAYNALKYYCMLSRVGRSYKTYKAQKTRASMFKVWVKRASQLHRAKRALKPLLLDRFHQSRRLAFTEWKRQAYFNRVCALLHHHLIATPMVFKLQQIMMAWRKYSYLKRNQSDFINHFESVRSQKLKQQYLAHWYQSLVRNLPARIICDKAAETFKKCMLRSALTKIATVAIFRTNQDEQATSFKNNQERGHLKEFYYRWKKCLKLLHLEKVMAKRQKRRCFQHTILVWYNQTLKSQQAKRRELQSRPADELAQRFWQGRVQRRVFGCLKLYKQSKQRSKNAIDYFKQRRQIQILRALQALCVQQSLQLNIDDQVDAWREQQQLRRIMTAWSEYSQYKQVANQQCRTQSKRITQQLIGEALNLRSMTLMQKAIKALRENLPQMIAETHSTDRSKLYSLFSSWKLYAKERKLLKRYLDQCGESPMAHDQGHFSFRPQY